MGLASMTGFARQEGQYEGATWTWEVKSVNARGLDVRFRLPPGLEVLEPLVRQRVAAAVKRGNVNMNLQLAWAATQQAVRINEQVLDQLLTLVASIEQRLPGCRPSSAEGLLGLRGVIDVLDPLPTGDARTALEGALLESLDAALAALVAVRRSEGERLAAILSDQLERLAHLSEQARALASTQPAAIFSRLQQQLAILLSDAPALPPDRLAQEAALLAARADPREELDRLRAHQQAAQVLLKERGPVGRQLDFLCQELNREANTLCSKSGDIDLTRLGLDLKATVEQVREQVQNIE
jgi:uncharacterized protein (TIGR00255 family)